jgi:NADH-quinone oxidoreductase subunit G
MLECADVLLPIATFAETPGTYVNAEGRWQSFEAAARPFGDAREGWRVLRVLGNEIELPGCEYRSAEEVRDELKQSLGDVAADNGTPGEWELSLDPVEITGELDVPIYSVDAVVRRATSLQQTRAARDAAAPAMPRKETA